MDEDNVAMQDESYEYDENYGEDCDYDYDNVSEPKQEESMSLSVQNEQCDLINLENYINK